MNDAEKLKAIIKRDNEVGLEMFRKPIIKKEIVVKIGNFVYDSNNNRRAPYRVGKQRPKVSKMIGEV